MFPENSARLALLTSIDSVSTEMYIAFEARAAPTIVIDPLSAPTIANPIAEPPTPVLSDLPTPVVSDPPTPVLNDPLTTTNSLSGPLTPSVICPDSSSLGGAARITVSHRTPVTRKRRANLIEEVPTPDDFELSCPGVQ